MRRIWSLLFSPPPPPDDLKRRLEAKRKELNQRNDASRARLAEIQVAVLARRTDVDA